MSEEKKEEKTANDPAQKAPENIKPENVRSEGEVPKKAEETPSQDAKKEEKPEEKPAQTPPPADVKKDEPKTAPQASAAQEAKQEKAEKKETPGVKTQKPSNCAGCNKSIKKKRWYYRNGKFYCSKRCWHSTLKKEEKPEDAQTPK